MLFLLKDIIVLELVKKVSKFYVVPIIFELERCRILHFASIVRIFFKGSSLPIFKLFLGEEPPGISRANKVSMCIGPY